MFEADFSPSKPIRKTIDLTSMIDIIFILLLFFMVSTTFSRLGVAIEQPESQFSQKNPPSTLSLVIDKQGAVFFEKEQLSKDQLSQLVKSSLASKPELVIVLHPDKKAQTQHFLDVMDICKTAGANQFSIAAKKKPHF